MELILQKDVKNLGKAGDRIRVKPGHARNYLLPNKMALIFNENKSKEWKHKKQIIEIKKKQASQERKESVEKLSSCVLTFEKESRSEGMLFGSVSPYDISKELEEKYQMAIDKKDIKTPPLKEVGTHKVSIQLDSEQKAEITVEIQRKVLEKEKKEEKSEGFFSRFKKAKSKTSEEEETTVPAEATEGDASDQKLETDSSE